MLQIVDDGPEYTDTIKKLRSKYDFPELKSDSVAKYYLKYNTDNWMLDGRAKLLKVDKEKWQATYDAAVKVKAAKGGVDVQQNVVDGDHLGTRGRRATVTQLEDQAATKQVTRRAVELVDVDIHPVMLAARAWPGACRSAGGGTSSAMGVVRRSSRICTRVPATRGCGPIRGPRAASRAAATSSCASSCSTSTTSTSGSSCASTRTTRATSTPEYDAPINRVVNEWIVEEWLDRDERLRSCISVPLRPPGARDRRDRALGGRRPLRPGPVAGGGAGAVRRAQVLAGVRAAADAGLPVAFHTGGYTGHRGTGWPSFYLEEHAGYGVVMQMLLTSLVCEGTFAAIPDLKVVMTEGGALWAAALRWRLDEAWSQLRDEIPELDRLPSEYIHDHVWFDTQPMEEPDDPAALPAGRRAGRPRRTG